jgi:hypothetical protein
MEFHGFGIFHGIPWNFMKVRLMEFHGIHGISSIDGI